MASKQDAPSASPGPNSLVPKITTSALRKKSVLENITDYYKYVNKDSVDNGRKGSWLEAIKIRSGIKRPKEDIIMESHFTPAFKGIYSLRFCPDEESFIAAYGSGAIQLWYVDGSQSCVNVRNPPQYGFPIMGVCFFPDPNASDFFACGACGNVFMCGLAAGSCQPFLTEENNEINSIDLSPDQNIVTGGKDAVLRVYDVNTKQMLYKLGNDSSGTENSRFHKMRVFTVKYHPEIRQTMLSGGWDDVVKIWDLRDRSGSVRDIVGPHICGDGLDIQGNQVLTGSWTVENSLQIWDLGTGKLIESINPCNRAKTIDGEFLYCCQYNKADEAGNAVAVGGSGLSSVEIIDIMDRRVIGKYKVQKTVQAIDTNSSYVVFGGMDTKVKVANAT